MGFQSDLLTGMAAWLEANGVGDYKPAGTYDADDTGIVLGGLPANPPDVIGLNTYMVRDEPSLSDSVIGLQVQCRTAGEDRRTTADLSDSIFTLLHAATNIELTTGVTIVQALRQSDGSLGQDQNGRWGHVQNFYLSVHRPSDNRW